MLIGIITRTIGLGKIPIGINVDEAGTMYDAYTIANYGTDRFGNAYPVYFINYGGGQITITNSTNIASFLFLNSFVNRNPNIIYNIENISAGILITVRLKPHIFISNADKYVYNALCPPP